MNTINFNQTLNYGKYHQQKCAKSLERMAKSLNLSFENCDLKYEFSPQDFLVGNCKIEIEGYTGKGWTDKVDICKFYNIWRRGVSIPLRRFYKHHTSITPDIWIKINDVEESKYGFNSFIVADLRQINWQNRIMNRRGQVPYYQFQNGNIKDNKSEYLFVELDWVLERDNIFWCDDKEAIRNLILKYNM